MNPNTTHRGAIHASFLAGCTIGGIRVALEAETGVGAAEFKAAASNLRTATEAAQRSAADTTRRLGEFDSRLSDIEQRSARRGGAGGPVSDAFGGDGRSLGDQVADSSALTEFKAANCRGLSRIETKGTITSAIGSTGGAIGGMVAPDRVGIVPLARRPLTIRSLIRQSRTDSNLVTWMKQSTRTNAAAPVAEQSTKPESSYAWMEQTAKVITIAHTVPVTRQALDDSAGLRSIVDGELRFGLQDVEEAQLLLGNGSGENLKGIMPQAALLNPPFSVTGETPADRILMALAQATIGYYRPSAIILNPADAFEIRAMKDTTGQYIAGGPYAGLENLLWSIPWVMTNVMPQNQFLLGDFANGAEIFDRMDAEVLIADQHADFFVKNMYMLRAEQRLTLVTRAPEAFVRGTLATE